MSNLDFFQQYSHTSLQATSPKPNSIKEGSSTSRMWMSTSCQIRGGIRLEIKCTINAMLLNHPLKPPPQPQSIEKLSSMKLAAGAKKVENAAVKY